MEPRAERLFRTYEYPDWLRRHSLLVGRIAALFVGSLPDVRPGERGAAVPADEDSVDGVPLREVVLAGYLHDLGRSPLFARDDRDHGEIAALVLAAEGLRELGEMARRHPIYAVLDPSTAPRTLAEKIVYVSDRRGGQAVEDLEERAADTAARHPRYADSVRRAIPLARDLEREVFARLPFAPDELASQVDALDRELAAR